MKKHMMFSALALSLTLGAAMVSGAEADLTAGVTVLEDEASPTGYTVNFVYEDADAKQIQLRGAFTFFYDEEDVRGITPEEYFTPEEWQNGMFEAGDESLTVDMEKVEGTDFWTTSMPLPSGHYQYVFLKDGDEETKLEDPTNPMEASGVENGNHYDRSTFYVPYDAEKQSDSLDFSFMAPIDEAGKVEFVNYTDVKGNAAPLTVYTPYGYDENAEEPYKVIYFSHGAGGNEMDWVAGGSVDYVFDNMISQGTTEPAVLVMMNNSAYDWDFEVIVDNLINCILPFVEENYHVATEPSGRAFTGLSMGGMTATNVLYRAPEYFGYIGIQSGSDVGFDFEAFPVDWDAIKDTKIMLGAGIYDFGLVWTFEGDDSFSLTALKPILEEQGVEYGWEEVYGSHDWNTWPQLIKIFAEDYLWK